jgi:hypothetical protein
MTNAIREAKLKLPLPELMQRFGLAVHAKKSARCPFHDDRHNSFSVWKNGAGLWFFKCHAGCGEGDEIMFLQLFKRISQKDAITLYLEMARIASPDRTQDKAQKSNRGHFEPIDWLACVDAFTNKHVEWLAQWRGYSAEFCFKLRENRLIGVHNDGVALPVHDRAGNVVASHYRLKDGSWRYHPQGAKVRPLVIGPLPAGGHVHIFESYWDAFAVMDKFEDDAESMIITRGAANGALVSGLIPTGAAHVFAWKQNDPEKNGKR